MKKNYTDEELIEWIKTFKTRKEIRDDNQYKYQICIRRNLTEHFPPKLNKYGNETLGVGVHKFILEQQKELKRQERLLKVNNKKIYKKKEKNKERDRTLPSVMYKALPVDENTVKCGRCLEVHNKEDMYEDSKNLCHSCFMTYLKLKNQGLYHNKWNIKDEFCNIRIREGQQQIYIGIKASERLENWLTKMGYGFIFKEVLEK